jgi:hypothetical protein
MLTERGSKKCKTRSGCSGIELISAFHVLQKFRDKIKTDSEDVIDESDLESSELEMEVDNDALVQLDGLLEWMDSKIQKSMFLATSVFILRPRATRSHPPARHS